MKRSKNWRIFNIWMIITIESFWKVSKSKRYLTKFLSQFLQKNMWFVLYAKFSLKIILNTLILQYTLNMRNLLITLKSISSFMKWARSNNFDRKLSTEKTLQQWSSKWQNLFLEVIAFHKWLKVIQILQQHLRSLNSKFLQISKALKHHQAHLFKVNEFIHTLEDSHIRRKSLLKS